MCSKSNICYFGKISVFTEVPRIPFWDINKITSWSSKLAGTIYLRTEFSREYWIDNQKNIRSFDKIAQREILPIRPRLTLVPCPNPPFFTIIAFVFQRIRAWVEERERPVRTQHRTTESCSRSSPTPRASTRQLTPQTSHGLPKFIFWPNSSQFPLHFLYNRVSSKLRFICPRAVKFTIILVDYMII